MRTPIFVECRVCGERWKVATVPIEATKLAAALARCQCPGCSAGGNEITLCQNEGEHAVTAARDGRPSE